MQANLHKASQFISKKTTLILTANIYIVNRGQSIATLPNGLLFYASPLWKPLKPSTFSPMSFTVKTVIQTDFCLLENHRRLLVFKNTHYIFYS